MRFWALCIVYFYGGIQLFNWVTGLHWLAEFSLPLTVVGGLGLAIASRASLVPSASSMTATSQPSAAPNEAPNTGETPSAADIAEDMSPPQVPQSSSSAPSPPLEPSISFTIHKNIRPQ